MCLETGDALAEKWAKHSPARRYMIESRLNNVFVCGFRKLEYIMMKVVGSLYVRKQTILSWSSGWKDRSSAKWKTS